MWGKKWLKRWVYEDCPGLRGAFPYFGTKVYFPKGSLLFRECCRNGAFERPILRLIELLARPGTWYLDVGANIGLMAVPVLRVKRDVNVISCEPSPTVLPYLNRTRAEAAFKDRWKIVPKAVSDCIGSSKFQLTSAADSAFEGIRGTGRVAFRGETTVDTTTIDAEWKNLGKPPVSVIKCDVEGAELAVLQGARDCLAATRPEVVTEWNMTNISAYGREPRALLDFARAVRYDTFSVHDLSPIGNSSHLSLLMKQGVENFLLLPGEASTN